MSDCIFGNIIYAKEGFMYFGDEPEFEGDIVIRRNVEYEDWHDFESWRDIDPENLEEARQMVNDYFQADYEEGLRSEAADAERKERKIREYIEKEINE